MLISGRASRNKPARQPHVTAKKRGSMSLKLSGRQRGGDDFPYCPGLLLDKFTAADNVTGGYTVLFIWAFAYLVAFGLNHLCAPSFEELSAPESEK
jgi:hypothetical protein